MYALEIVFLLLMTAWLIATNTKRARVTDIMNVAATAFFDAHVRGAGAQVAELECFFELEAKTNLQALGGSEPAVAGRPRF